jgi:hypothetical protein
MHNIMVSLSPGMNRKDRGVWSALKSTLGDRYVSEKIMWNRIAGRVRKPRSELLLQEQQEA